MVGFCGWLPGIGEGGGGGVGGGGGGGGGGREEATPCFSCMASPFKMICSSSQHKRCSRQKGL